MNFLQEKLQKCFHFLENHASFKKKQVFTFQEGCAVSDSLIGSKAAVLCEMSRLGLPVPPGFIVTSENSLDEHLVNEFTHSIRYMERVTHQQFGGYDNSQRNLSRLPILLLRVRSPVEDKDVINLGINDSIVHDICEATGDKRFALGIQLRFLSSFGETILGRKRSLYEDALKQIFNECTPALTSMEDLSIQGLETLTSKYKAIANFDPETKEIFDETIPNCPWAQLDMAVRSLLSEEHSTVGYVGENSELLGTRVQLRSVIVQAMVFGNMNKHSGRGSVFSRSPSTGENELTGYFFRKTQGKRAVAGEHPRRRLTLHQLQSEHPNLFRELKAMTKQLEQHFNEAQQVNFIIENGVLFILQARPLLRTPKSAIHIAVEMVRDQSTTESEAILKLSPSIMKYFLTPMINPDKDLSEELIGHGMASLGGAVSGKAVFTSLDATLSNEPSILILKEVTDEILLDMAPGISASIGVLVLSKVDISTEAWNGKCVISGAAELSSLYLDSMKSSSMENDYTQGKQDNSNGKRDDSVYVDCVRDSTRKVCIYRGQSITLDGPTGRIINGSVAMIEPASDKDYTTLLQWCDRYRKMDIMGRCDTKVEVLEAIKYGAEGIGLLKVESLLKQSAEGWRLIEQFFRCSSLQEEQSVLVQVKKILRADLMEIFAVIPGKPATILLYYPSLEQIIEGRSYDGEFSGSYSVSSAADLVTSQVTAILEAARVAEKNEIRPLPRMAIPFVALERETILLAEKIHSAARNVSDFSAISSADDRFSPKSPLKRNSMYEVGVLVATPRTCIRARHIAFFLNPLLNFVLFDSDSLTKLIWGINYDEIHHSQVHTSNRQIVSQQLSTKNPFVCMDEEGVGELICMAKRMIRIENPSLTVGVVGKHCSDPSSVKYFDYIGIDNVTCDAVSIPGARVSAAQAHIQQLWCSSVASERQYKNMPCDVTHMLESPQISS